MKMTYEIQIGNYSVKNLVGVKIHKNADLLSDTATIELPAQLHNRSLDVEQAIKRRDPVLIKLGYNDDNKEEFRGYVYKIETAERIIIHAEDAMLLCRKALENKEYKKEEAKLPQLVKRFVDEVNQQSDLTAIDGNTLELTSEIDPKLKTIGYDKFLIDKEMTAWDAFKRFQKDFGLHIFVRKNVLHVQAKYQDNKGVVLYNFSSNVEKSSLKYRDAADKKLKVKVIGFTKTDNKKLKGEQGEKGGDQLTFHLYDVSDEASLQLSADEYYKKHNYSGYEGSIDTWLLPVVTYGYHAKIEDELYTDRAGTYYIEAVTTTFNDKGGKRNVKLGIKI